MPQKQSQHQEDKKEKGDFEMKKVVNTEEYYKNNDEKGKKGLKVCFLGHRLQSEKKPYNNTRVPYLYLLSNQIAF